MRRARNKLQVSTFPFLAVLLGAMGALIFLLLVMDRRAKLAARNKAREAQESRRTELAQRDAEKKRQDEERLAALERDLADSERLRKEHHERLRRLDKKLFEELSAVHATLAKADGASAEQANADHELRLHEAALRAVLAKRKLELDDKRNDAERLQKIDAKLTAELTRLSDELGRLEALLAALRSRRGPAANVYSLVPYRGRNGSERKPIYVECNHQGLLFQPDGKQLLFLELTAERIGAEIAGRGATLEAPPKRASDGPPRLEPPPLKKGPYVLCLIRPDGIESYERLWSALRGTNIDFGYELVEADWKLDFSAPSSLAAGDLKLPDPRKDKTLVALPTGRSGDGPADKGPPYASGPGGSVPGGLSPGDAWPGSGIAGGARPGGTSPGSASPGGTVPGSASAGGAFPGAKSAGETRSGVPKVGPAGVSLGPPHPPGAGGASDKAGGASDKTDDGVSWRGSAPKAKGGGASAAAPGDAGPPEPGDGAAFKPTFGPTVAKTPPRPASLGHLLGNRDLHINLACTENEIVVGNTGQTFVFAGSDDDQRRTAQTLVQAVRDMVARRQASVRPGETPFRPLIKFQIYNGGLRTYFRAYPLLDSLRYPMTRENVE